MDTKKIISDAMMSLLKKKPFESINVQLILDVSGVSRSTFYKHFADKYELMNWCYLSYAYEVCENYERTNWKSSLYLIFKFLDENHKYFENAFKVQGKNSFYEALYNHVFNLYTGVYLKNTDSKALTIREKFMFDALSIAITHCTKEWMVNGRRASIQEMTEWIYELIPEMCRQYMTGDLMIQDEDAAY